MIGDGGAVDMFELTFLGTSSGVPTKSRNVSGLAISLLGEQPKAGKSTPWILIDCGEGTQHRLLYTHHKPSMLRAIFITHAHGDHCYGLLGLLSSLAMHGRKESLKLIAPASVLAFVRAGQALTQMNLSYALEMIEIEAVLSQGVRLEMGEQWRADVAIYPMSHRIECYGFAITQQLDKLQLNTERLTQDGIDHSYWRRILKSGEPKICTQNQIIYPSDYLNRSTITQKIVIAGDNDAPKRLTDAVKDASLLIHEATYTQAVMDKILAKGVFDPQHSSAHAVGSFADEMQVPNLILTHFSARFLNFDDPDSSKPNIGHIRAETVSVYGGRLILAEDLMTVSITKEGIMSVHGAPDGLEI